MATGEPITLTRECDVVEIPSGTPNKLAAGDIVKIMQNLGSTYTVFNERGGMFRIDAKDADALGFTVAPSPAEAAATADGVFTEQMVWDQLKTVFDPEIPVNIADLGLIYSCLVTTPEDGGKKIDIKMTLTAPGCGMGNVLKMDVEKKLARLPEVKAVNVEVVLDPPWSPSRMSEAAKLQLGFDI